MFCMRQKKEENNMVIEQRPRYKKYKTSNYNSVGHKSSALPQNSISKLNMRKGSFHMNGSKRNTKNLENMKIRLCKKKSVVHQSYNNYYDSNKSINSISSINNLKLGHKSVSLSGNIRTDRSNSDALNSTGNTQHFQTNSLSNDLPFVLDGLQTGSKSRAQVFHFGSRGERTQPKAALNHTAVFLNKTGRLQEVCQLDEVPDENVDERSLSRIRDRIVNRGSITNRLHKSFENYCQQPRYSLVPKANQLKLTSTNLIKVNLDSPVKSPMHSAHRGVVSSNYFPPRKPNSHMMSRSGNFTQRLNLSNGSFEIDARLSYNKFLSLVENKTNSHKKMIIQDLKLFSAKFSQNLQKQSTEKKEKKCKKRAEQKVTQHFKGKRFASVLFIQKAFKILLEKKSLAKSPLLSISQLAHSSFMRTKYLAKAYILGWKTRKLLGCNEIQNYKRNISDLIEFAKSQSNQQKFILKAKNDYIDAINKSLKNPSWWKTYIISKSLQEKQERVQKIRERNKRLKEQRIDVSPSNYSQVNQIQSCKAATDGFSGSMTMAFDFSSAAKRQLEEPTRKKAMKQTEEKKQKNTNFLKRRSNLKYDPAKSIKEEKNRVEKIIMQSDLNSECFGADENDADLFASATAIKLSSKIQKGQVSVKEIMNTSKGSITRSKPIVSENFQNLDYLKNVPRRIDCWLHKVDEKEGKELSTPRSSCDKGFLTQRNKKESKKKRKATTNQSMNCIEGFAEFSKDKQMLGKTPEKSVKMHNLSKDFQTKNKMNDSQLSGESMGIVSLNASQLLVKSNYNVYSPESMKDVKCSQIIQFKSKGECLDFLLDNIEYNSFKGIFTSEEKNNLRKDKRSYDKLANSKTLREIYKLLNKTEKSVSSKRKKSQDATVEKYIAQLKEDYASILMEKSKSSQVRGNRIYTKASEAYQSSPSKEEQGCGIKRKTEKSEYMVEAPRKVLRNNNKSLDFKQEKGYSNYSKIYPRLSRKEDNTAKPSKPKKQSSLLRKPTEIKNRKIVD